MPDTKISDDPITATPADADSLPGVFGGANGRMTWAGIKAFLLSSTGLAAFTSAVKGLVPASGGGTVNFLRADGTWSAPPSGGSGGGATVHPGYVAGRFYSPGGSGITAAGVASVSTATYFALGRVEQTCTISALAARITTVSAGGSFQLAIYANDTATMRPTGAPIVITVAGSTASAATLTLSLTSNTQFAIGYYWFAIQVDNSTAVYSAQSANNNLYSERAGNIGSAGFVISPFNGLSFFGTTYGTWPNMSGASTTETTSRIPSLGFQVASVP